MSRVLTNHDVAAGGLDERHVAQAYNALDAALTWGIHERLQHYLVNDIDARRTYRFQCAMLGPAFTMQMRGIKVDEQVATSRIAELGEKYEACLRNLRVLAEVWLGEESAVFNPASPVQVKALLYTACGEEPYHNKAGGETANEDALMQLTARSPVVGVLAQHILRCRELQKAASFLKAARSPDGRMRSSFNVAATTSGRWSFSKDPFGDGLNFGNIPRSARDMFVADDGMVMINTDLSQAESNIVARISRDEAYIEAHESGDVHSAVARLLWSDADPKAPGFYRGMSRRSIAKAVGHGTNYGVGVATSSKLTALEQKVIRDFREGFFTKFSGVKRRIDEIGARIAENPRVVSLLGRPHQFLGDPRSGETQRAALADEPQGAVADVLNTALWSLWFDHDVGMRHPPMQMLSQAYDSTLLQCRVEHVEDAKVAISRAMRVKLYADGEQFVIPHDMGVGRNWKEASS